MKNYYQNLYIEFIQRTPWYRLCLARKCNVFNKEKFISEPWTGNSMIGKNILDSNFVLEHSQQSIDILHIISQKEEFNCGFNYIYSFSWLRDLQAIGGNYSRRYARKAISEFITRYRATNSFWLQNYSWKPAIIAERIVNWIISYSFVASGASEKFQKQLLSSINEQFTHLLKIYKGINNPHSRILVLKSLFFCIVVLKKPQLKQINKILLDLQEIINTNIKIDGMFYTRNPIDHFNIMRYILEIRFIAKKNNIAFASNINFFDKLPKLAMCVRMLRLGDGCCSTHIGAKPTESYMHPTQHIVDSVLSLIELEESCLYSIVGFERLATKDIIIILNTEATDVKSHFNHCQQPGINIFDFEASFGQNRLINRSDISILFNNLRIKAKKTFQYFVDKSITHEEICFFGEAQMISPNFCFAMKRDIYLSIKKPKITGKDIAYISGSFKAFFRFVLHKNTEIEKINHKKILLSLHNKEYLFEIKQGSESFEIIICKENYPTIEVESKGQDGNETFICWSIEEIL